MGGAVMNALAKLTRRESEIAEMFAWGASKKEVADRLFVSERTVENHARNIYGKTGCGKVNELSAWWFCTTFHISFDLSPLKQRVAALAMLLFISPQVFRGNDDIYRVFRGKITARTCRSARRKPESKGTALDFAV